MKLLRWNKLRRESGADQRPGRSPGIRRVALRIALFVGLVSFVTLAGAGTPASAAGPYPVPGLASITFTLPPTVLTPVTTYFNCLARTDHDGTSDTMPVRVFCYDAPQPAAAPPPPPPPYKDATHLEFTATYYASTGRIRTNIISCAWIPPTALRITMEAWLSKTGGPATNGSVTVRENNGPLAEEDLCAYGTETTGPLTLTPLPLSHNADIDNTGAIAPDSCTTWQELGSDPTRGGLRDPWNPYDFYDVASNGGGPPDGVVDLFSDVLGVISHYSLDGSSPYDARFDRGASVGPSTWNMTGPDGIIDLFTDILGVIVQYGHNCTQN